MRQATAPGHVYSKNLRCELCDYVLTADHIGPNFERRPWNWNLKTCPNCKKKGIKSFLVASNK